MGTPRCVSRLSPTIRAPRPRSYPRDARSRSFRYQPGRRASCSAAKRAGIKDVILCERNKKDIDEIDEQYIKGLNIHYVDTVSEVLDIALLKEKIKNPIKFAFDSEEKKEATV